MYIDFTQQPLVINGCSDLMKNVFGEKGVHARAAVSEFSSTWVSVEIEAIFPNSTLISRLTTKLF